LGKVTFIKTFESGKAFPSGSTFVSTLDLGPELFVIPGLDYLHKPDINYLSSGPGEITYTIEAESSSLPNGTVIEFKYETESYYHNGVTTFYKTFKGISQIKFSPSAGLTPGAQNNWSAAVGSVIKGGSTPQTQCPPHDWIDVGFRHSVIACKHCGKLKDPSYP
jgi:hypothetical protein